MRKPSPPPDAAEPAADEPWLRNRKLRQRQLDLANEHGRQLVERYDHGGSRPQFAVVSPSRWRLRRNRG
jgi:hypothetical protein